MAREVLSVKLDELDNEFEKMRHRIKLSREACHSRIREELVKAHREYAQNELALRSRLSSSRAETVSRISQVYGRVEQVIQDAKAEVCRRTAMEEWSKALSAEEKALLAEYALDFAMQAANRALLISLEAIDAELTQQEKEEE